MELEEKGRKKRKRETEERHSIIKRTFTIKLQQSTQKIEYAIYLFHHFSLFKEKFKSFQKCQIRGETPLIRKSCMGKPDPGAVTNYRQQMQWRGVEEKCTVHLRRSRPTAAGVHSSITKAWLRAT